MHAPITSDIEPLPAQVDRLGRVVIPSQMRKLTGIDYNSKVKMSVRTDGGKLVVVIEADSTST